VKSPLSNRLSQVLPASPGVVSEKRQGTCEDCEPKTWQDYTLPSITSTKNSRGVFLSRTTVLVKQHASRRIENAAHYRSDSDECDISLQ
jgi:hypothetical protein